MWKAIAALLFLTPLFAQAEATLSGARFSSCTNGTCIEIKSEKAFQGHLGNGIYFSSATVRLLIDGRATQTWSADSVFFDAGSDRLFIRSMQKTASKKSADAYYEILQGKFHILAGVG